MTPVRITLLCSDSVSEGIHGPIGMTTFSSVGDENGENAP